MSWSRRPGGLTSVLDQPAQQDSPSYSSQRLASPAHLVSNASIVIPLGLIETYSSRRHGRWRGRDAGVAVTRGVSIVFRVETMSVMIYRDGMVAKLTLSLVVGLA